MMDYLIIALLVIVSALIYVAGVFWTMWLLEPHSSIINDEEVGRRWVLSSIGWPVTLPALCAYIAYRRVARMLGRDL